MPSLVSDAALERTIDKVLTKLEGEILSSLKTSLDDSNKVLENALPKLEQEYDKIVSDGKKEAEKIEKQIVGSSDLEVRNKQLVVIEESIDKVFKTAVDKIGNIERNAEYGNLIQSLLDESTKVLGTSEIIVFTNSKDQQIVKSSLSKFPDATLSNETIGCLGGVQIKSKDGTMTFDNTIDARIERMKPLIRKEIANKFGVGN